MTNYLTAVFGPQAGRYSGERSRAHRLSRSAARTSRSATVGGAKGLLGRVRCIFARAARNAVKWFRTRRSAKRFLSGGRWNRVFANSVQTELACWHNIGASVREGCYREAAAARWKVMECRGHTPATHV